MRLATIFSGLLTACSVPASSTPQADEWETSEHGVRRDEDWVVSPAMVKASIETMNTVWYNQTDGRWNSTIAWWLSGNALQAVCDYMVATGDTAYVEIAENTIEKQSGPLDWWPEGGGEFRADSTDDTVSWWALALVRLYDVTKSSTYLDTAKLDADYIYQYWNDTTCGGGVIWAIPTRSYKNAVSNELLIKVAASLHNRLPGDTEYLDMALQAWDWFNQSGLINAQHLVNDGLTDDCANNGGPVWTYNQGVILGALAELHIATGSQGYLDAARQIADAAIASAELSPGGILTDYSCELLSAGCDNNQQAFKGILTRNLAELDVLLEGAPYTGYLKQNARAAWTKDQNEAGLFGISWDGPYVEASIGSHSSAASLLIANIWSADDEVAYT